MTVHQTRYLGDCGDGHEFVCDECDYHERWQDGQLVTVCRGDMTVAHVGSTRADIGLRAPLAGLDREKP